MFSPLFVCSERTLHRRSPQNSKVDIAFDDASYIYIASTRTLPIHVYILCGEKLEIGIVLPVLSPELPKNGG